MKAVLTRFLLIVAVSFCQPLYADPNVLVQHRSAHPLAALLGVPAVAVRVDRTELQLSIEHSNVFMGGVSDRERLFLDGETTQLHLRLSQRLTPCWQVDGALVYRSHVGGFIDEPIENWHRLFGLPNAERHLVSVNQLDYFYESDGVEQRSVQSTQHGLGGLQLSIQRLHGCERNTAVWRAGIKVGVDDDNGFFSSGGNDLYVDWQSSRQQLSTDISAAYSAGFLTTGQVSNLPQQRAVVAFGSLGAEWQWTNRASIIAQLDWHTPLFKSRLEELGNVAGQFTLAARRRLLRGGDVEISFSEDIVTDTAPDFSLRLAWRHRIL